MGWPPLLWACS